MSQRSPMPVIADTTRAANGGALRGALAGLVPLALLAAIIAAAFLLTALVRQATAPEGFYAQQQAVVIVLVAGLVIAAIVYVVTCVRTLRRAAAWRQVGISTRATGALAALAATALIVLLPFILAVVLPQHPAP
jgi:hypothetical protein